MRQQICALFFHPLQQKSPFSSFVCAKCSWFIAATTAWLPSALNFINISFAIFEKAREVGAHSLSGAIIDPRSLNELIPDYLEKGVPFVGEVAEEHMYYLSSKGKFRFPYLPKSMSHHGCYVASLGQFTRWLGKICEE